MDKNKELLHIIARFFFEDSFYNDVDVKTIKEYVEEITNNTLQQIEDKKENLEMYNDLKTIDTYRW